MYLIQLGFFLNDGQVYFLFFLSLNELSLKIIYSNKNTKITIIYK